MLIGYLTLSTLLGLFLSIVWTTKDWPNACIKVIFVWWTMWSTILLAGVVWPLINNGSIKLI